MPRRAGERSAGIMARPRPAAAALLLAAVAGLRSAAALPASLSGPGAPAYPLSPQLTPAQLLNAAVLNAGAAWPNTSGTSTLACPTCGAAAVTPIWCASARVAAYLRPDSGTTQLGDAFVRLQPTATAAIAAVRALAEGQAYTVDYRQAPTVLAGSNVWLLNFLNRTLPVEVPVYYDIVRVPDAVWQNGLAPKVVLDSYLLDTLGYDCVLDASMVTPEGHAYHQFLPAHQTYGYSVVGDTPVAAGQTALAALFTWVKPFSPGVWGLIVVAFIISSFLMTIFERGHSLELWDIADFGPRDGSLPGRLNFVVHGVYIAISSFTSQNCEMFVANSVSGRMYRTMYSFFIMLSCSCYVANLAAVLSQPSTKMALVESINSFAARNIKACVLNRTDDMAFMATYYPQVTLHVVNSGNEADMLPLILGPGAACGGAVARDSALNFLLGPIGDPGGEFCSLSTVGGTLNQNFHAIAFSIRFPLPRLAAMRGLVSSVVADGSYAAAMATEFSFPKQRTTCATTAGVQDTSGSLELSIVEFSGVFVILALGGIICLVVHVIQRMTRQKRLLRMSSSGSPGLSGHTHGKPLLSGLLGGRASGAINIPASGFDFEDVGHDDAFGGSHALDTSPSQMSIKLAKHAAGVRVARAAQAKANLELQHASATLEEKLRLAAVDMQDVEDVIAMMAERSNRGGSRRMSRTASDSLLALADAHAAKSTPPQRAPEARVANARNVPSEAGGVRRAEPRLEPLAEPRSQGTPPQESPPVARGAAPNGSASEAARRKPSTDTSSTSSEEALPPPPPPPPPAPTESGSGVRFDPRTGRRIPAWDVRL